MRVLALIFCLITAPAAGQSVERMDPPNWWAGMAAKNVQLLLKGDAIGGLAVRVDYPGVALGEVNRFANSDYLAVTLELGEAVEAGDVAITLEGGEVRIDLIFPLLARASGSAQRRGFDSSDVVYLVQPDRFANGDLSNDTIEGYVDGLNRADPGGRHGGDLAGLVRHVDYIADMGFTQLWLNPVQENDEAQNSYHGYAITDSYAVDPRYGTLDEYIALSEAAAARGIGLIMDVVPNHFGSNHYLNRERPGRDWFNGAYRPTNHRQSTIHDPYAADRDRRGFEDGWFAPSMPDIDQSNTVAARYLIQNAIWWIETVGLSGLRIDTYAFSEPDFMVDYTRAVRAEYPNLSMVAEVWSLDPVLTAPFQHQSPINPVPDAGAESVMDFPLLYTLVAALTEADSWDSGLARLYNFMASDRLYAEPQALMTFADNHDFDRIHTQLGDDVALTKMALSLILSLRGTPQILYGTEYLATNETSGDHGQIRSDFPGGFPGDTVSAFTGQGLSDAQADMQAFLRTLVRWRSTSEAAAAGEMIHFVPEEAQAFGVYAFGRLTDEDGLFVVVNKTDAALTLDPGPYREVLGGFETRTDVLTGERAQAFDPISAPARAVTIFDLDR